MAEQPPGGYAGKILRVNLSANTTSVEEPDEKFYRKYIGGAGFIAHYLHKELKLGIDPLGPENKLIFALGPLTGVSLAGNDRNCVGAKSPLTGGIIKSEVGGLWAAELKHAGFDGVIVDGKAEKPVYLWIHNGEIEIRDASNVWGKTVTESQQAIRDELGDRDIKVLTIGPAGEKLVRFANVMTGVKDAGGRSGMGALLGSKNLKAVAARGTMDIKIAHPAEALDYDRKVITHTLERYVGEQNRAAVRYGNVNRRGVG